MYVQKRRIRVCKTMMRRCWARNYRGADKSLARLGRKQARKHVRDARDFNKIERRAVIKFLFLQGKAPKEIHAILTETLACCLPGRANDLSAPLYLQTMKAPGSFKTAGVTCTMTQHHISGQLNPHQQSSRKLTSHTLWRTYIMTGSSIMTAQEYYPLFLGAFAK